MMKKQLFLFLMMIMMTIPAMAQIVITEINYNDPSAGGTGDSLEYIEIYNTGDGSIDMNAYMLRSGITFTFSSTILPGFSYLVIARNMNAVQNFYGISGVLQWDAGQSLSNAGEAIVLADADTITIDSVRYFNTTPWPTAANGTGASMMLCDPSLDNNVGTNWIAANPLNAQIFGLVNSITLFGTPGGACIQNPPYVPVFATFPYTDSFDNTWIIGDGFRDVPNNHWKNTNITGNASWRRDNDGASAAWTNVATGIYTPAGASGTSNSARFHSSSAGAGVQGSLDLYIDLSTTGYKRLSFWYINTGGTDSLAVWLSEDNGLTFTFLQKFITTTGWEKKTIDIGNILSPQSIIRFRSTGAAGTNTDIGLDELEISLIPATDAGIAAITSPGLSLNTVTTDVKVLLRNYGSDPLTNVDINWSIDGTVQPVLAWAGTLAPLTTGPEVSLGSYTFPLAGTSNIVVWTSNPNGSTDADLSNDTATSTTYYQPYASFPFYEGFDSTWTDLASMHDVPSIFWTNTPANGNNSWRRQDDGVTATWTAEANGVYTPAGANNTVQSARFHTAAATAGQTGVLKLFIDLSAPGIKELSFWHINTSGNDSLAIWISSNGGSTFTYLTKFINDAIWNRKVVSLNNYNSANTVIMFRATAANSNTDMGLDEVTVSLVLPDVGVTLVSEPASGCDIPANSNLVFQVTNFSQLAVDSIPVVTANGLFYITDTLQPGASILLNAGQITIPAGSSSSIMAYTNLIGDNNPANDTLHAVINNMVPINTFPFLENFETGNTVYFNLTGNTNALTSIETSIGNNGSTGVRLTGNAAGNWPGGSSTTTTPVQAYSYTDHIGMVTSSCMVDATSLTNPEMTIDLRQTFSTGPLYCYFRVMLNDTIQLTDNTGLTNYNPVTQAADAFVTRKYDLAAFAGTIFKLSFQSSAKYNNATGQNGFGDNVFIDNIRIKEKPAQDVGVIEITSPVSGCGLTNNESVVLKIKNFGTATAFSFATTVTVGAGLSFPQFVGPILPGDTAIVTFTGYDLSAIGPYEIVASTHLTGDLETYNDTLIKTVVNAPYVNTYPHIQDFESVTHGWTSGMITGINDWVLGTPAKANINTTHSGTNCWITGLTANYSNSAESYVMSSCYDLSTIANPILSVWLNIRTQNNVDAMILESSTDGVVWTKIVGDAGFYNNNSPQGTLPAPKWSGTVNGWVKYQTSIAGLAGNTSVKFRFRFVSNATNNNEGIAIDDFEIFEAYPDLSITQVFSPVSGCQLGSTEIVQVMVTNVGAITAQFPPVAYKADNGTWVTETIPDSIPAGVDYLYTFIAPADLSAPGAHTVTVASVMPTDINHTNDTVEFIVSSLGTISAPPVVIDFETPVFVDFLGFTAANNAAVFIDPAIGVMGGTGVVMTGNQAGNWPGGSSTTTTAAEAFSYTDHIAKIFSCDIFLPTGVLWALTLDLQQTYSTGPAYSWFRVMLNNSQYLPELFTGDTTFNPATENSDAYATHLFALSSFASPMRLSLESSNKYNAANAQNGIGDNAHVDNVGIIIVSGVNDSPEIPLVVFPNPVSDVLYLQYPELQENASLNLLNAQGQLIQSHNISGVQQSKLDVSQLVSGVYTLRLQSDKGTRTVKFVKVD